MLNKTLVSSFLSRNLSVYSYQIWIFEPKLHVWTLFHCEGSKMELSSDFDYESCIKLEKTNSLTLSYPQDFKVTIISTENLLSPDIDTVQILYHLLYPVYTHLALRNKETELQKLIDGVQKINSALELDELLTRILDNVAAVIPGANTSALWMYNPAIDRLTCKAYRGWKKDIEKVHYKIGESVTGRTYQDGKSRIYYKFREANDAMKDTSEDNMHYLKSAFHHLTVKACMTVPISFQGEIIGVLGIHLTGRDYSINEWDLQLLNSLCAQIAIAIVNARLFTEIQRKNHVLMKRNEIHSSLTNLSLQNKGAEAITQELNRMVSPSLLFVDMTEYECFPKKQRKQLRFSMDELSKLVSEKTSPIYVDLYDKEEHAFYIYPVLVGTICLGCLVISITERPLTQLDHMLLEQGGSVLALELSKRQSLTEVYYKKTHQFYVELLQNQDEHLLYSKGFNLGIDLHTHMFVTLTEIPNYTDLQVLGRSVHRLVSTIKKKTPDVSKIVFGDHNLITVLISLPDPENLSSVIKKLKSVLKEWEMTEGIRLYGGIGSLYQGISSISKSQNEAHNALSYVASRKLPGIIQITDIGINRLFLKQSTEDIERFILEIFAPLDLAKGRKNELVETLITYFQTNRSTTKTAELLHLHINTLYQRLRKIEELMDVSLDDPDTLLKIHLACHLRQSYMSLGQQKEKIQT
ncbi:helix-turn-helix domain-containing protein [Bacillus sp. V5-8f]|uniref:helix-turn-helix domain-containing protein n=1 Tax=Bacillus sp. V5-8f TaxID=2053044 RepID=UPI000C76D323|nr:helix-turn-helix domain-containing protein [Bacillus sp. V5-8f]PLT35189.1 hypothetical protein CUU64_07385 [Bacillus sp. V5-8f]